MTKPKMKFFQLIDCEPPMWGFYFSGGKYWGYDSLEDAVTMAMKVVGSYPEPMRQPSGY